MEYTAIVAANVKAERARRGLSQKSLAKRMRELGYKWHFQTSGAVERGERHVPLAEIPALALALETTLESLLYPQTQQAVEFPDETAPPLVMPAKPVSLDYPPGWASPWNADDTLKHRNPEGSGP